MLFAFSENPGAFEDHYLANGLPGKDGIPDILNESRWGLDWLLKMNPSPGIMYNQIADDRDHIGFRFPIMIQPIMARKRKTSLLLYRQTRRGFSGIKTGRRELLRQPEVRLSFFKRGQKFIKLIDLKFSELLLSKAVCSFQFWP